MLNDLYSFSQWVCEVEFSICCWPTPFRQLGQLIDSVATPCTHSIPRSWLYSFRTIVYFNVRALCWQKSNAPVSFHFPEFYPILRHTIAAAIAATISAFCASSFVSLQNHRRKMAKQCANSNVGRFLLGGQSVKKTNNSCRDQRSESGERRCAARTNVWRQTAARSVGGGDQRLVSSIALACGQSANNKCPYEFEFINIRLPSVVLTISHARTLTHTQTQHMAILF